LIRGGSSTADDTGAAGEEARIVRTHRLGVVLAAALLACVANVESVETGDGDRALRELEQEVFDAVNWYRTEVGLQPDPAAIR
jgi:hypothetical protein